MKTKDIKKLIIILTIIILNFSDILSKQVLLDSSDIIKKLPLLAGTTSAGGDYWFAIPPCYEETSGQNFIRVFCVSPTKNNVTCEISGIKYKSTKTLKANELIVFNLTSIEGQPFIHTFGDNTPPARTYIGRGIHVYSDNPILVYVIVRFMYSTDGFLALPTNGLGKEYIAGPYTSSFWSGLVAWTLVTAAYDNTKVIYSMGGDGVSQVETESKGILTAGKSVNFTLQKGDVYVVGAQKSLMDIAGSKVLANKPVAVTTGVHCANIPTDVYACDYNAEMELPTETWGKAVLVPVCLNRTKPGLIRIFAKYPDTKIYRDGSLAYTISTSGGVKGIGWFEDRATPLKDSLSPYPVIYTADKPFSIMYYNPGTTDDPVQISTDPFQMVMTPVEQFQSEIYFGGSNATGGAKIDSNYLNIVYELENNLTIPKDLEFGTWNGSAWIYKKIDTMLGKANLFNKNVPTDGKLYGVKNISIPKSGTFKIRSISGYKFGCYSYGFDSYDSYGYPTSTALKLLEINDVFPPVPTYTKDCDGSVGWMTPASVTDKPDDEATRSNLSEAYMYSDSSYNYIFEVGQIISGETITTNWKLYPIDSFLDSKAVLVFKDRAGNDTIVTIENFATKLKINKDQAYGNFKPGDIAVTKDFWLKNDSKKVVNITKLQLLRKNVGFTLEPLSWVMPKALAIGDSLPIKVTFTPDLTLLNSGYTSFIDSIGVGDECTFGYKVEVRAGKGDPEIMVDDYNFGQVDVADANAQTKVIRITNNSKAADLAITGFTALHLTPFTTNLKALYPNLSKANPIIVSAGKYKEFTASFKPNLPIQYKDTIIFHSDARITDSLCILEGEGFIVDLSVEDLNNNDKLPFSPNPVHSILKLDLSFFKGNEQIQIIDLNGRRIIDAEIKETIDVSNLINGTYILKIGSKEWKFIKE
ncbi:MAG: T9SS type A sorting domain-containing protein [Candidatus Kapabacteria bacterium]|nr:T9SS type A sorting domain-containing protein [Candidatus Kapabacteria bacterium]